MNFMKNRKAGVSKTIQPVGVVARIFFPILFFITLSGCDKETTYPQLSGKGMNLEHFIPGSWWKYEWNKVDGTTGEVTPMASNDSVYVKGDTVINGNTYIHLTGTYFSGTPFHRILRDSLAFLVDQSGAILFSLNPEPDTLKVAVSAEFTIHTITKKEAGEITIPAGTFSDLYERQNHYYRTDGSNWACGTHWVAIQYLKEGVGILYERTALLSELNTNCSYIERKLVAYYLAN